MGGIYGLKGGMRYKSRGLRGDRFARRTQPSLLSFPPQIVIILYTYDPTEIRYRIRASPPCSCIYCSMYDIYSSSQYNR